MNGKKKKHMSLAQDNEMHIQDSGLVTQILPHGVGGYGPWYCMMLFNTSKASKKQTHLVAHSNPDIFPLVMNRSMHKSSAHDLYSHSHASVSTKRQRISTSSETGKDENEEENEENVKLVNGVGWVLMQIVGPFKSWTNCHNYLRLWDKKTRGKTRRLERGVVLFSKYAHSDHEELTFWGQTKTKQTIVNNYHQQRKHQVKESSSSSSQHHLHDRATKRSKTETNDAETLTLAQEQSFYTAINQLDGVFKTASKQNTNVILPHVHIPLTSSLKKISVQTIREIGLKKK